MKQNGFTLIELLAVILILGIIALIAIPTVNKIIKEAKRGGFETTANNLVSAIEDACQFETLKGEPITATYTFTNGVVSPSLNVKGKLPTAGTVTVDSSCNVTLNVTNGTFTATKTSTKDQVTVIDGIVYANGTAVYFNPVTGLKCDAASAVSTTGTKTGCMKWYAFNDDGASSETINLILDHNTTALVAWNSTRINTNGPTNILTQLASDTSSWSGVPTRTDSYSLNNGRANYTIDYSTYKARLITGAEIARISGNTDFNEQSYNLLGWFYLDSNNKTQVATTTGASKYAWLYDYTTDCTSNGCNIADNSTLGYWTATVPSNDSNRGCVVYKMGTFDSVDGVGNADYVGLRPVITVNKSSL